MSLITYRPAGTRMTIFLDYRNNDQQYFIDTGTEIGGQP